jgi:hypothetical protein
MSDLEELTRRIEALEDHQLGRIAGLNRSTVEVLVREAVVKALVEELRGVIGLEMRRQLQAHQAEIQAMVAEGIAAMFKSAEPR